MKVHSVADLRPKYTDVQELGEGWGVALFLHIPCVIQELKLISDIE